MWNGKSIIRRCALRRAIMSRRAVRLTYSVKGNRTHAGQSGFPYRLEYSMVKREWYLIWYHLRHHALMITKLDNIVSAVEEDLRSTDPAQLLEKIERMIESGRETAVIEVVNSYNRELSRILYAFSCFEKEVAYDSEKDTYTVHLTFLANEREYVLSKIRFLGKRVRIIEGDYLRKRMLESSVKALERYGVSAVHD
ncbi:WYL domain-containing protein [Paenibacillus sp. P25]|nr:WYL domain-containing protein [Paenibacillus sp. P25]